MAEVPVQPDGITSSNINRFAPSTNGQGVNQLQHCPLVQHQVAGHGHGTKAGSVAKQTTAPAFERQLDPSMQARVRATEYRRCDEAPVSIVGLDGSVKELRSLMQSQPAVEALELTHANLLALEQRYGAANTATAKRIAVEAWLSNNDDSIVQEVVGTCNDLLLVMSEAENQNGKNPATRAQPDVQEQETLLYAGAQFSSIEDVRELESFLESGEMLQGGNGVHGGQGSRSI